MPTFQLCQVCSCPEGRLKGFGTDLGGLGLDTVDFLITLFFAFSLGAVLGAAFALLMISSGLNQEWQKASHYLSLTLLAFGPP